MPGANARALEKARGLDADVLIFDLEDAVAPERKAEARALVMQALATGGYGPREIVLRVNEPGSRWFEEDVAAAVAARPDAVLLPKVEAPGTIIACAKALAGAPETRLWAMIETPRAILDVARISACARDPESRLDCLVLGVNDLAKETRARFVPGRTPMLAWLSNALLAARADGLDILDGVFNGIGDAKGFAEECAQGRDLGFDGKTLVHPSQIETANRIFAPDEAEVAQARAIIAAFARPDNAKAGVVALDGRMVERLHARIAERVVALADAIAARR
ncbi:MAG: CoA ester lyase [Salinarimonadaceae bacterium]|nr:MAG: CoA ester lyase [Salinarimonadaceae bacterium]